jgi:transposase
VLDVASPILYSRYVKRIVPLKLQPTSEDHAALLSTLERANDAVGAISETAWQTRTFRQFALQKATYSDIRARFGRTAQLVVRVTSKVVDAYKLDRERQRTFRRHGSIAYDDRILRYGEERVSIWTVEGRRQIPFVCDERARKLLAFRQGESDLVYRDGRWYLFATVNVEEPPEGEACDVLGIDLGVVNLAVDSDGNRHSGTHVNNLRRRHRRLRAKLSAKWTSSSRRLLRRRRRKERRFVTHVNHTISKRIVAEAKRTNQCQRCGLAGLADRIAAVSIRARGWAEVSRPHADAVGSASGPCREPMPPLFAGW